MRKINSILILLFIRSFIFSQEELLAQKELLGKIEIGASSGMIQYHSDEEGFYAPNGPMVDRDGRLLFYPSTTRDEFLVWSNNIWSHQSLFKIMKDWSGSVYSFVSQEGFVMLGDIGIIPLQNGKDSFFYPGQGQKNIPPSYDIKSFAMPFGTFTVSTQPVFAYSTELIADKSVKVRDLEETSDWLPSQPGGFSIGDDGLLYRNGILWSAKKAEGVAGTYIGKLMSGHNVYQSGERYFRITNATGAVEVVLEMPWATDPDKGIFHPYNFGLGPWGEFYCLIPPEPKYRIEKETTFPYWDSGESELVVVRNHLKYFGRLNDGGVRLRKDPSTTGEIIGTYPNKTGFRILETGTKSETIAGQTNVWYKVRLLDGKEGWFFGAFVHNLYNGPNGNPPPWPNVPDW